MVDMSEIYKNKKKALVRGSGDLATGVGVALYRAGFQVIMTDIAVPLTVRDRRNPCPELSGSVGCTGRK